MANLASDPDFKFLAVDKTKVMSEAPPYDAKKDCWIPDVKDGYIRAEIVSTKGDDVVVKNVASMQVRDHVDLIVTLSSYI